MTSTIEVPRTSSQVSTEEPGKQMRAIVRTKFGPPEVLQFKDVEKPAPSQTRGVLLKVYAASVNPADRYGMKGPPFLLRLILPLMGLNMGLFRPKERGLGTDVAGRVEAVADNVSQFKPGDEVFGVCPGAYAEYALAREDKLAVKPANASFEQAAAVGIAGFTALQALRDHGHLQPGEKVLVNGAGGGVGTFAVQIAKALGADVTAVTNTQNLAMVRSIGADHVIDYTQTDFAKSGQRYDLICDIAAAHSISEYKRILNPSGICVIVGSRKVSIKSLLYYLIRGRLSRGDKKFVSFIAKSNQKDLAFLKDLIEAGKLTPVVDRRYRLAEIAEAMRYLETGQARGKIIITTTQS